MTFALVLLLFLPLSSIAQVFLDEYRLSAVTRTENLDIPWEMEWAGDLGIFFTELDGKIKRLDLDANQVTELYEIPDLARENQSGLMGLALHPDFPQTPQLFVTHTYYTPGFDILLKVLRLEYDATNDELINPTTIFDNLASGQSSTGSRLVLSPDQHLFFTLGDLENGSLAQETDNPNGKVHRINLDGSIPGDNPIAGSSIWSYGHRNPQGLVFADDGTLYSSEHGPFSNDELNIILEGRNYGWPLVSGACTESNQDICDQLNMVEPLETWTPTVAPAGMAYYNHDSIAEWTNSLLIAGLKAQHINWVKLSQDGTIAEENRFYFGEQVGRIRDILVTPGGRIFLATSNTDLFGTPRPNDDRIVELEQVLHNSIGEAAEQATDLHVWVNEGNRSLQWKREKQTVLQGRLFDLQGREVQRLSFTGQTGSVDLTSMQTGVYLLHVSREGATETHKIRVP